MFFLYLLSHVIDTWNLDALKKEKKLLIHSCLQSAYGEYVDGNPRYPIEKEHGILDADRKTKSATHHQWFSSVKILSSGWANSNVICEATMTKKKVREMHVSTCCEQCGGSFGLGCLLLFSWTWTA